MIITSVEYFYVKDILFFLIIKNILQQILTRPHWEGLVVSMSASHAVGSGFTRPCRVVQKTIIKMVQTVSLLGTLALGFDSAARLFNCLGSVWNCLWGHALKDLLG